MNNKKIAIELTKIARELQKEASSKETVKEVIEPFWNKLHDLEDELEEIAHKYDVAASYKGKDGERYSKIMLMLINRVIKQIEAISMNSFSKLVNTERKYVKLFGTPDEYSDKVRREIFPN